MAEEIDTLIGAQAPRPVPTVGGYRSGGSLSADEMDEELMRGFGA